MSVVSLVGERASAAVEDEDGGAEARLWDGVSRGLLVEDWGWMGQRCDCEVITRVLIVEIWFWRVKKSCGDSSSRVGHRVRWALGVLTKCWHPFLYEASIVVGYESPPLRWDVGRWVRRGEWTGSPLRLRVRRDLGDLIGGCRLAHLSVAPYMGSPKLAMAMS